MVKEQGEGIENIIEKVTKFSKQSNIPLTELAANAVVARELDKIMKSMRLYNGRI